METSSQESLKPLTFKVSKHMYERMEDLIASGFYENKAELIRIAIQKLIDWELKVKAVLSANFE